MSKCIKCGSYAFNLYKEDIDQGGLCDVHYWQYRAHRAEAQPEPVAIALNTGTKQGVKWLKNVEHGESLYTTPPQRKPDNEAYTALEQALMRLQKRYGELEAKVAAQQQPVGYVAENGVVDWNVCAPPILTNLYTTPPQRKWVGLTDEEVEMLVKNQRAGPREQIRYIEAKLKEKNGG